MERLFCVCRSPVASVGEDGERDEVADTKMDSFVSAHLPASP